MAAALGGPREAATPLGGLAEDAAPPGVPEELATPLPGPGSDGRLRAGWCWLGLVYVSAENLSGSSCGCCRGDLPGGQKKPGVGGVPWGEPVLVTPGVPWPRSRWGSAQGVSERGDRGTSHLVRGRRDSRDGDSVGNLAGTHERAFSLGSHGEILGWDVFRGQRGSRDGDSAGVLAGKQERTFSLGCLREILGRALAGGQRGPGVGDTASATARAGSGGVGERLTSSEDREGS